jgi:dTDP-4-amino-4,6-dideoxygalactose transaminase
VIRIAQPLIGPDEEEAVLTALRSGQLAQGPIVARFEEELACYLGVRHAVAVSSGTAALIVALRANGIGDGDEVLVPAFTFAATANAVLEVGARPVLMDIREDSFNIDLNQLETAVGSRTRAVLPVHLYGHPCEMSLLEEIADRHGLLVIEDACQAIGASWEGRRAGSFGAGCFSFYATKNMTTGEGGMVATDDGEVARRARLLRNQGEEVRYRTDLLGANFRMTELAAALGGVQLSKVDGWNERRRANAAWLSEHLEGVVTPRVQSGAHHVYHQYTVRVPEGRRDALLESLREQAIEAAVYYPRCVHQQPLYRELGIGGSFPVAERAAMEVLSLPVHPGLSPEDLKCIAAAVNEAMASVGVARD